MAKSQVGWNKKFLALIASSRPLQATFSITQPLFAALLAASGLLRPETLILLIIGSIAGMFSVFALNDLLDYDIDKKIANDRKEKGWDIDSVFVQHPLTRGLITPREQIAWVVITGAVSGGTLYLLNPLALALFFLAILLELGYCRLAMISELKVVLAGTLVAVGTLIGWFAAGGGYDFKILLHLSLLFFAWEIGGRNIPNDFSDIEEDKKLGIKTVPSTHGIVLSSRLIVVFALLTVAANILLGLVASLSYVYIGITTLIGIIMMVMPSLSLAKNPSPSEALAYFNKASLYPVFMFIVLLVTYAVAK